MYGVYAAYPAPGWRVKPEKGTNRQQRVCSIGKSLFRRPLPPIQKRSGNAHRSNVHYFLSAVLFQMVAISGKGLILLLPHCSLLFSGSQSPPPEKSGMQALSGASVEPTTSTIDGSDTVDESDEASLDGSMAVTHSNIAPIIAPRNQARVALQSAIIVVLSEISKVNLSTAQKESLHAKGTGVRGIPRRQNAYS